jgi:hypothetical protein
MKTALLKCAEKLIAWARSLRWAGWLQRRIVCPGNRLDYLVLFLLALCPLLLSPILGVAHTQTLHYLSNGRDQSGRCWGYWDRWNWTSLTVLLPLALWVVRHSADRLFKISEAAKTELAIIEKTERPDWDTFRGVLLDPLNSIGAFAVTVLIHFFDLRWQAYYLWHAWGWKWNPAPMPPPEWDWTTWFLTHPHDSHLYFLNLILDLVAYPSQFVIALLAVSLIVILLRHNCFYLDLIYVRSRAGENSEGFIVLDFGSDDGSFGLKRLSRQFDYQIILLAIAGAFTLLSRFANSDAQQIQQSIRSLTSGGLSWSGFVSLILPNLGPLFPTAGQICFPIAWLLMFVIVLLPARVKLLPLRHIPKINEGARDYLLQLIPPGSKIDRETASLHKSGSVDELAEKFARQSFWPDGDAAAQFYSVGAFAVFFLMLGPVPPHTPVIILYYVLLVVAAFACSKVLFWYFRYRLAAKDKRLAGKPQE